MMFIQSKLKRNNKTPNDNIMLVINGFLELFNLLQLYLDEALLSFMYLIWQGPPKNIGPEK